MASSPAALGHIRLWLAAASPLRLGLALGFAVALVKLPFVFTTLGEQDHGRLMMDAILYSNAGASTLRRYGIVTSPLWTLSLAGIASIIGNASLVLISNVGGWLCGGFVVASAFVLLTTLGAPRAWATSGALAAAFVPGTFYLSLYGLGQTFEKSWGRSTLRMPESLSSSNFTVSVGTIST